MFRHVAALAVWLLATTSTLYAQDTTFTVSVASASVHAGPSTGSPVVGSVPRNRTVGVTRDLGSWVRIDWPSAPTGSGYLHVTWGTMSKEGVVDAGGTTAAPAASAAPAARRSTEPAASPAVSSRPAAERAEPAAAAVEAPQQIAPIVSAPGATVPVSHVFGLGARLAAAPFGFAATGRVWTRGPFGVQAEFGRTSQTSSVAGSLRTVNVNGSVVYSLRDIVTPAVWVRPYLGGGAGVYRSSHTPLFGVTGTDDTGFGGQAFGGAEFTWAGLPQLGVSAEIRQEWAPSPFAGFETAGLGIGLSAHWYLK